MPARSLSRFFSIIATALLVSGCATFSTSYLQDKYGPEVVRDRTVAELEANRVDYWSEVKPILEQRCVSCHGCYDASCQMKLTSIEGVLRGASRLKIYDATRIRAAHPSRLFEDAQTTEDWREKGFHPVLNERSDILPANQEASPMYRLLKLKETNPLPDTSILPEEFTLSTHRENTCPTSSQMDKYEQDHPLWGMPYGLPGLDTEKQNILKQWLEQGAVYTPRAPLNAEYDQFITRWEKLFNADSKKARLSSRYIYEHLFLTHLYFSEHSGSQFFKLVRSTTPPGQPVDIIATRRPYDDPGTARVYYRLVPELETIVAKSHIPYALNPERLKKWKAWFYEGAFTIDNLPGYESELASNPFKVFQEIPVNSRYRFLLDESQISIMNFIKGAVCRGQVALNVIRDHFWVFFVDPDVSEMLELNETIDHHLDNFDLPAGEGDIYVPLSSWAKYANKRRLAIKARNKFLQQNFDGQNPVNLDLVWDGDGNNANAALTIFRHFNSATVEKGLLGQPPKTAWLISYPLLEQIHYLLVAGYDVYGNYGHQLVTRLYMDFLRIDGEISFLGLLPNAAREQEWSDWYQNGGTEIMKFMINPALEKQPEPDIKYVTDSPKRELFFMLQKKLEQVLPKRHQISNITDQTVQTELARLSKFSGPATNFLS